MAKIIMDHKILYSLGILPSDDIQTSITHFKNDACNTFQMCNALNAVAHLTLIRPFTVGQSTFFDELRNFLAATIPITIELDGFDHFDDRVIYVDVKPNEALQKLQQVLEDFCIENHVAKADNLPFHAHMTIARDDTKLDKFDTAYNYFSKQNYTAAFTATTVALFRFDGQNWQVDQLFSLKTF